MLDLNSAFIDTYQLSTANRGTSAQKTFYQKDSLTPGRTHPFNSQSSLSRPARIMYFQKLDWIIEEAIAVHRPVS
jgi:hypothetical protein